MPKNCISARYVGIDIKTSDGIRTHMALHKNGETRQLSELQARSVTARCSWNQRNTRGHNLMLRAIALALRGPRLQQTNTQKRTFCAKLCDTLAAKRHKQLNLAACQSYVDSTKNAHYCSLARIRGWILSNMATHSGIALMQPGLIRERRSPKRKISTTKPHSYCFQICFKEP